MNLFPSLANEHLAMGDCSLRTENPPSIDFHIAAITENQQLFLTLALLVPANEFGVASESAAIPRPSILGKEERVFFCGRTVDIHFNGNSRDLSCDPRQLTGNFADFFQRNQQGYKLRGQRSVGTESEDGDRLFSAIDRRPDIFAHLFRPSMFLCAQNRKSAGSPFHSESMFSVHPHFRP